MSSFSESHTSHGRARHQIRDWSESGRSRELLTPGTSDSCRPRGVVTRDFSAIFDRLFDRLPVRISTSDLHHWILRKKIFHIRAYDLPLILCRTNLIFRQEAPPSFVGNTDMKTLENYGRPPYTWRFLDQRLAVKCHAWKKTRKILGSKLTQCSCSPECRMFRARTFPEIVHGDEIFGFKFGLENHSVVLCCSCFAVPVPNFRCRVAPDLTCISSDLTAARCWGRVKVLKSLWNFNSARLLIFFFAGVRGIRSLPGVVSRRLGVWQARLFVQWPYACSLEQAWKLWVLINNTSVTGLKCECQCGSYPCL